MPWVTTSSCDAAWWFLLPWGISTAWRLRCLHCRPTDTAAAAFLFAGSTSKGWAWIPETLTGHSLRQPQGAAFNSTSTAQVHTRSQISQGPAQPLCPSNTLYGSYTLLTTSKDLLLASWSSLMLTSKRMHSHTCFISTLHSQISLNSCMGPLTSRYPCLDPGPPTHELVHLEVY